MDQLRSWMFVPGHIQKMIDKAAGLPVDSIMLDIEDGVLPAAKPEARERIHRALSGERPQGTPRRYVRINSIEHPDLKEDLAAAVTQHCDGIVIPKVEEAAQIREIGAMVEALEAARHIAPGRIEFLVAVESAKGLLAAYEIARASARNTGLIFGAEDYTRDLGLPVRREREARELVYARSAIVNAAAAAGIQSVDGVWPDIQELDGLREDSRQARELGFTGKSLIHPAQIDIVNATFTPSADDIAFAERVIEAFKMGEERGLGAVALGGQLLDRPIVDRAYATLQAANREIAA